MLCALGFAVFLSASAFDAGTADLDDGVTEWVSAKLKEQRTGEPKPPTIATAGGTLWVAASTSVKHKRLGKFVPPTSFAPLVRAVRGGVVNVSTVNTGGTSKSTGSGFIINANGLVVTNSHVVEHAEAITVRLDDGTAYEGRLIGRDPQTDLALLWLVGASKVSTVTLGDSDDLEVGDWVVAIGNPFGLETSITHGIISARERAIGLGPSDQYLQTNALLNPGNSGGPLFDTNGDVVGVTTAIERQGQGIAFAVPINLVKETLPNLFDNGPPKRGWLGVNVKENDDPLDRFTTITQVVPGSPAAKAGIREGDRLVSLGGKPVERYQELVRRVALQGPGTSLKLGLIRNAKRVDVSVTLGEPR